MGYYLLDNPPARKQFYAPPRANPLTGGVAVHTSESVYDNVGTDTGAENVAGFISRRTDGPGSYHRIVDADSTVALLPDDYTAFHVATSGYNSRTWGIALACRTTDLDPDDDWTKAAFARLAREIVDFWVRNGWEPNLNARWLPLSQTLTMPGLFHHGDVQSDRDDAWEVHPQKPKLQALLLTYIFDVLDNPEDEVPEPKLLLRDKNGKVWLTQGISKVHVPSPAHADLLRYIGVKDNTGPDSTQLLETLGTLPNGV